MREYNNDDVRSKDDKYTPKIVMELIAGNDLYKVYEDVPIQFSYATIVPKKDFIKDEVPDSAHVTELDCSYLVSWTEEYHYFMASDIREIRGYMALFGVPLPRTEDFRSNTKLEKEVRDKMQELGVYWSILVNHGHFILNYYNPIMTPGIYVHPLQKEFQN